MVRLAFSADRDGTDTGQNGKGCNDPRVSPLAYALSADVGDAHWIDDASAASEMGCWGEIDDRWQPPFLVSAIIMGALSWGLVIGMVAVAMCFARAL